MRGVLFLLAFVSALAFGQPTNNGFRFNQYDSTVGGFFARDIPVPISGGVGILIFDQTTQRPTLVDIGTGLSYASGILTAGSGGSTAWSSITGTPTTLSGYAIADAYPLSGNPSSFLNQAGVRGALSLTTTGSNCAGASYTSGTGMINVPGCSPGTGTVTSVIAGTGLSGGTITTTGTLSLPNTGTAGTYSGVTTDTQGRVTAGTAMSINDAPARSLVTSTSATGFQISSTRNSRACYEGSVSTTSTIGGPASASVFLETADTNSTTPSDWTTKAQQTYTNTITLAIVLNQVQANNWSFCRDIPAGKFVRIRSGSVTGTASASLNANQQETTM